MEEQEHKKYNTAEMVIGGFSTLMVDGVCFLIDITGVGLIIAPVIQSSSMFLLTAWAIAKGDKNSLKLSRQLIKQASNILPFAPTIFLSFIIEAQIHNNPEKFAKMMSAGGKLASIAKLKGIKPNSAT